MEGRISKQFMEVQQRDLEYTDSFYEWQGVGKKSSQKYYRSPTHNGFIETFPCMTKEGGNFNYKRLNK